MIDDTYSTNPIYGLLYHCVSRSIFSISIHGGSSRKIIPNLEWIAYRPHRTTMPLLPCNRKHRHSYRRSLPFDLAVVNVERREDLNGLEFS
jgi:hypothetical protein